MTAIEQPLRPSTKPLATATTRKPLPEVLIPDGDVTETPRLPRHAASISGHASFAQPAPTEPPQAAATAANPHPVQAHRSAADRLRRAPWVLRYRVGTSLASDLRRLSIKATHRHCRVEFRGPVQLGPGFTLRIPDHGTLIVGHGVDFRRGFVCEISGQGRVTIGDGCIFTSDALVQCSTSIDIERGCVFGQSTMIVDGKHRYGDPERPSLEQGYDYRPLRIGADTMVMAKCTVFADIGQGAFIGANSVVSRPVPAHCLAVGAPAKPIEWFDHSDRPQSSAAAE